MNFRQLECFVAVVDEGSFTRAARRDRDHAAVALAAHQGARARARRSGARPVAARRVVDAGRPQPPARGAHRGARARARPAGRALRARTRARRARDRHGALDGGRRAARGTSASGTSGIRTSRSACTSSGTAPCSRTRSSRASPTSPSGRGRCARWDGPLETVAWEEFVRRRRTLRPAGRRGDSVRLEELREREWVLYHPDHGLAGIVDEHLPRAPASGRGEPFARRRPRAPSGSRPPALGIALVPDNIVLPALDCGRPAARARA